MNQAGERLPWLTNEPAPAPAAAGKGERTAAAKSVNARTMWPWYLLLVLLIAGVAIGGWWLGTRQRNAAAPELPAEQPQAVPLTPAEPAVVTDDPVATGNEQSAEQVLTPPPAVESREARARPRQSAAEGQFKSSETVEDSPSTDGTAVAENSIGRSVFPADEPAIAPVPLTGPRPIVVYHPQQNRGRVVQLGAFPSRVQAEETWRRVVRRYPYLAGKPKMVNTVEVRALGSRRRTRMYRLQLGTSSQAQSAVICQQLERAGQSCVVVY